MDDNPFTFFDGEPKLKIREEQARKGDICQWFAYTDFILLLLMRKITFKLDLWTNYQHLLHYY